LAHVKLDNITKDFGPLRILKGVSLDIADGEFLTLVGPSGCGKSTLLRIIAGLEAQSGGDVTIDGKLVNKVRPSRRDLAMVFQSYALYPHLSVAQNLATPLLMRDFGFWERMPVIGMFMPGRSAKREAMTAAVRNVAETLKIEHLLDRKPGQLSGGQRQRVALGRAMVRDPHAFLMDEPLSNLDAALRVHMRAELAGLHRSLRTTFIYVTHDQAEALTMSDRMAVMMDGEVLQVGAPSEIYQNPDDRRVAEFIGSPQINILPAQADRDGRLSCLGTSLSRQLQGGAANGVDAGLRPEHMELRPGADGDCMAGKIVHKENLGSDIYLHLSIGDGAHRIVVRAKPHEALDAAIGDEVHVGWAPGKLMAFGADGRRLALTGGSGTVEQVA
jgi:multiple sugar transport system ATP-binding protein